MATTPRLPGSGPEGDPTDGRPPSIRSVRGHNPTLRAAFDRMYGTLWSEGVAAVDVKEAMRLRNARVTGCGL